MSLICISKEVDSNFKYENIMFTNNQTTYLNIELI